MNNCSNNFNKQRIKGKQESNIKTLFHQILIEIIRSIYKIDGSYDDCQSYIQKFLSFIGYKQKHQNNNCKIYSKTMKEQINLYQPQTLDYNDQLNLSKTKETIKNTSELDSFKFQCLNGQQKCDTILKYQFLLNQQKNFVEQDTKTLKFAIMIMENFIQHNAIDSSEESIKKFRNKSQRDNKQIIGLILCVMTHFDLCENLDYDRREQKKSLKYFLDKDEERVVFSNNQEQAGQEVKRKFIRQSQKIVEKYQYNEQFTFKNTIFEKNIKVFNNLQINLRLL